MPFPSPEDLPDLGMEPWSPALQADSLPTELPEKPYLLNNYTLLAQHSTLWHAKVIDDITSLFIFPRLLVKLFATNT